MTTNTAPRAIAATSITVSLRRLGFVPGTDFTSRNVPGAFGVAVAVTVPRPGLRRLIIAALRDQGLLIDRDRDLVVASVPQPLHLTELDAD